MDIDAAKEFLMQFEILKLKSMALERAIANLEESPVSSFANYGMPKKSGTSDPTGKIAAKIANMKEEAAYILIEQIEKKRKIERVLLQLNKASHFAIMWAKYIDLKDWGQIADEQDRTVRTVQRIHGQALQEVAKLIDRQE